MNEREFWVAIWRILAGVLVVFMLVSGGCTAYENTIISDMVKRGVDPMVARCGMSPGNSAVMCAIAVSKAKP